MGSPRKLLVTGSSGLIGSRLQVLAEQQKRGTPDSSEAGLQGYAVAGLHRAGGTDICDAAALTAALGEHEDAAALIHLAAFTDVSAAHLEDGDEAGACYQINVVGTQNVAAACAAAGIPWVHVSTDFVFSGEQDRAYTEADTPDPIEWYGRTKWWAEQAARAAGATVARVSFPYALPPAPKPDFVRWILGALQGGKQLHLFDDQYITPTFVDDMATGLLLLAQHTPGRAGGGATASAGSLFHLSGGESTTPYALGVRVAELFGCDPALVQPSSLVEYLQKDPRPRQRCLRISNERWLEFAAGHAHPAPLGIAAGLARVRAAISE